MFLSKIFGIFKKKKDSQVDSLSGGSQSTVTPTEVVGAAAGMAQPSQPQQPVDSSQPQEVAQADTSGFTMPDVTLPSPSDNTLADSSEPAETSPQPETTSPPETTTPPSDNQFNMPSPSSDDTSQDPITSDTSNPSNDEPVVGSTEQPPAPDGGNVTAGTDIQPSAGDDSQSPNPTV